jgi:hypothetical protein
MLCTISPKKSLVACSAVQTLCSASLCVWCASAQRCLVLWCCADPFVSDEFVARVAGSVNYYLVRLNGPQVSELRVEEPQKYFFFPRVLCAEMVGIFLHLSKSDKFIEAVAADERLVPPLPRLPLLLRWFDVRTYL